MYDAEVDPWLASVDSLKADMEALKDFIEKRRKDRKSEDEDLPEDSEKDSDKEDEAEVVDEETPDASTDVDAVEPNTGDDNDLFQKL